MNMFRAVLPASVAVLLLASCSGESEPAASSDDANAVPATPEASSDVELADTSGTGDESVDSGGSADLRAYGESISFFTPLANTTWDLSILGLVELGLSGDSDPSPCVAILTTMEATQSDVDNPRNAIAPPLALRTAAGVQGRGGANCDFDAIENEGYGHIDSQEFAVGVVAPVFIPIVVRTGGAVEAIVVGNLHAPDSSWEWFDATPLTEIPRPS